MASVAVVAGHIIEKGIMERADITPIILLSFSTFMIVGGANILNDLDDIQVDQGRSSRKPIASGLMKEKFARGYFVSLWTAAIIFSMITSILLKASLPLLIVLVSIFLLYCYERFLKKRGLPGNIMIGLLTGAPFLLGASITGISTVILWIFLMAVFSNTSREITKDIEDARGDSPKRKTLPIRIGGRKASFISSIFLFAALFISAAPVIINRPDISYVIPVGLADIIFLLSLYWIFKDSRKAQQLAKLGMICAVLGFIIWSTA